LTIENNGNLIIENNAKLYPRYSISSIILDPPNIIFDTVYVQTATPAIHVIGGGFMVGNNVTFDHLNTIQLEIIGKGGSVYNDSKLYAISNATFKNTPLVHKSSLLKISNCTFNQGSDVSSYISKVVVDSCIFNKAGFIAEHNGFLSVYPPFNTISEVKNCNFNGPSSNNAISIGNSSFFTVMNNKISGYDIGISLNNSGNSMSLPPPGSHPIQTITPTTSNGIYGNKIGICNTGIELFSSAGDFLSNHIYENNFGVRLLNNVYAMFNNDKEIVSQPQIIRENNSFELYASEYAFPYIFRWNQIIDKNLGNTYDDPLIYWDIISTPYMQNVNMNYWGEKFDIREDLYPYQFFICDSIWTPGKGSSYIPEIEENLYNSALTLFSEENYDSAETAFTELIENYPQSPFAIAAMHELIAIRHYTNQDFTGLHNYFSSFTPADSTLYDVAQFLATRCNVKSKQWQPAIDWYENRIESPPSYPDSIFAVIDLGNIHLMMEMEMEADSTGLELKSKPFIFSRFPELKPISKETFEVTKNALLATLPQKKQVKEEKQPVLGNAKGQLSQNIPNPATESTTIIYELFEKGIAEIEIYNALGQLIQSIPQGTKREGIYQVDISLVGIPAGLYSYALLINGERIDTKKMVVQ
jgi:tetratricopeptide (TPR) repeat protein